MEAFQLVEFRSKRRLVADTKSEDGDLGISQKACEEKFNDTSRQSFDPS